jgi:hypothetical protein
VTCSYSDFAHSAKSDTFTFSAVGATSYTQVDDSVTTNGETATQIVPIAIH